VRSPNANASGSCGRRRRPRHQPREKTLEAIQKEVIREVDQLLRVAFSARRKTGCLDLEALEITVRPAMHQAGAGALTKLSQFPTPTVKQWNIPCTCCHEAATGSCAPSTNPVLIAVGMSEV